MIKKTLGIIPRSLIKNKKRTVAIAISIILSIILITSTEILIRSVINASIEANGKLMGKYYASYSSMSYKKLELLQENEKVDKIGTVAYIGIGKIDVYKLELYGIESIAKELLNIELIEGKFPIDKKEIAMEKWMLDKLYPNKKVGDKIILHLSLLKNIEGGMGEACDIEFTLAGVLNNLMGSRTADIGKIYMSMEGARELVLPEEQIYNQYFTLKANLPVQSTLDDFNEEYNETGLGVYHINENYIYVLNMSEKSKYVVIFMDIIIALTSSMMIYNIFNMSIVERIRQFGLLKLVGITPKQIKGIVLGEGLLLGIFCIPIGIVFGIYLVKLLIFIIGGLGNRKLIVDSNTYNAWLITIVGFGTIVLSGYKPAKLVANISTIEALNIESSNNGNMKGKGRPSEVVRFISGYTGKMAFLNLSRNKKRFIATVMSICMGVTIFLSINYFIGSIDPVKSVENTMISDFILNIGDSSIKIGYSQNEIDEISKLEGITEIESYKLISGYADLKKENMTVIGIKKIEELAKNNRGFQQSLNNGIYSLHVDIIGCNKETIDKITQGLNLYSSVAGKPIVYVIQSMEREQLSKLKIGDNIETSWAVRGYPTWEHFSGSFEVGGILEEVPLKIGGYDADIILITEEENLVNIFDLQGYQRVLVSIDDKNSNEEVIEKKLEEIANREKGRKVVSYREDLETIKRNKFQVSIILYVLFITAALSALVNIVNTINMNVITRKREFGMLRAIGMTMGQIKAMIIKEGLAYGLIGSFLGAVFGIACSYAIYTGTKDNIIVGMEWSISTVDIFMVVLVTMLITTISALVPLRKVTKTQVVEAIRAIE